MQDNDMTGTVFIADVSISRKYHHAKSKGIIQKSINK